MELGETVLDFFTFPLEVFDFIVAWALLADVTYEALATVMTEVTQEAIEEVAGGTDEGALIVFVVLTWMVTDDGKALCAGV